MKLHPLRGKGALEEIRDFEVEADGDARQKFEHRHLRAEAAPNRAELEANRAGADDEKFLGRLLEAKCLGAAHNRFAVERHAREVDRHAAGRNHDVVGCDFGRLALVRLDPHFARLGDGAETGEGRDFVALHQRAHASGERFHDLVFATEHGREVEADLVEHDAVFGRFLFCKNKMVAGGEQRLARDAADIEAGAAEFIVLFDDGGFESELRGADGGDVAARTGADDDDVEFIHGNDDVGLLFSRGALRCHPERRRDLTTARWV